MYIIDFFRTRLPLGCRRIIPALAYKNRSLEHCSRTTCENQFLHDGPFNDPACKNSLLFLPTRFYSPLLPFPLSPLSRPLLTLTLSSRSSPSHSTLPILSLLSTVHTPHTPLMMAAALGSGGGGKRDPSDNDNGKGGSGDPSPSSANTATVLSPHERRSTDGGDIRGGSGDSSPSSTNTATALTSTHADPLTAMI